MQKMSTGHKQLLKKNTNINAFMDSYGRSRLWYDKIKYDNLLFNMSTYECKRLFYEQQFDECCTVRSSTNPFELSITKSIFYLSLI